MDTAEFSPDQVVRGVGPEDIWLCPARDHNHNHFDAGVGGSMGSELSLARFLVRMCGVVGVVAAAWLAHLQTSGTSNRAESKEEGFEKAAWKDVGSLLSLALPRCANV